MAYARPSLSDLVTRIESDFSSRLTGGSSLLRRSFVKVMARVYSGAVYLLYGYIDWVYRQAFPDTAEKTNLERWARIWKVTRKPADFTHLTVTLTGNSGVDIPLGTELQNATGLKYTVDALVTTVLGTATAAVTAESAGTQSNIDVATVLTLVSPIAGINSNATVASVVTDGSDAETDDSLRARLMNRIQQPPHGGSKNDYQQWALEVSGVTRAWPYPNVPNVGAVTVLFVVDNDVTSIIPSVGKIAEVQAYIDDASRKPATADVIVAAPIEDAVAFNIALTPNTSAVRAAVTAELQDLFKRESSPGGTIYLSHIREAISTAADEINYVMSAPSADLVAATGHIKTVGVITFS